MFAVSKFCKIEKSNGRFDEQIAILDNAPDVPTAILFHPFEPNVVIADDTNSMFSYSFHFLHAYLFEFFFFFSGISVWNRETNLKLNSFRLSANVGTSGSPALGKKVFI